MINDLNQVAIKTGLMILFIALVHTAIRVHWEGFGGINSTVIPVRSAIELLTGIGLIACGMTLM